MRPGPAPKPTALKKLSGSRIRDKKNRNEPAFSSPCGLLQPPRWLDRIAREEWQRIAPELVNLGLLTVVDAPALQAYCMAFSNWMKAEKAVLKYGSVFRTPKGYVQQRPEVAIALSYMGQVRALAAEFGFTPASRSKVSAKESEEKDPMEEFLERGGTRKPPAHAGTLPS